MKYSTAIELLDDDIGHSESCSKRTFPNKEERVWIAAQLTMSN